MNIEPETIARMANLVRRLASDDGAAFVSEYKDRARQIVKLLPADDLLLKAREICTAKFGADYSDGRSDDHFVMRAALVGIHAGIDLARERRLG